MFDSLTSTVVAPSRARFVQALMLTAGLLVSSSLAPASASQVASDKFVFDHVPHLVSTSTTNPTRWSLMEPMNSRLPFPKMLAHLYKP